MGRWPDFDHLLTNLQQRVACTVIADRLQTKGRTFFGRGGRSLPPKKTNKKANFQVELA